MSAFEVSPIDAKVQKELYRKMIAVNRLDLSSAFNQENKTEQDGFQQQSSALDNASIFQPRDIMNDDTNPFKKYRVTYFAEKTGGGNDASHSVSPQVGSGGSGIVIVRFKSQNYKKVNVMFQ